MNDSEILAAPMTWYVVRNFRTGVRIGSKTTLRAARNLADKTDRAYGAITTTIDRVVA